MALNTGNQGMSQRANYSASRTADTCCHVWSRLEGVRSKSATGSYSRIYQMEQDNWEVDFIVGDGICYLSKIFPGAIVSCVCDCLLHDNQQVTRTNIRRSWSSFAEAMLRTWTTICRNVTRTGRTSLMSRTVSQELTYIPRIYTL